MLDMLGSRQKALLQLLLKNKVGMTVEAISEGLSITRNAVRQHLASLENEDLVQKGVSRATGGRPEQLYVLTDKGAECFPRHYTWFAQMLIESMQRELGDAALADRLSDMGAQVGKQLLSQHPELPSQAARLHALSDVMQQFGYAARIPDGENVDVIEADNCVFHALAFKNPHICKFDLALMSQFTGQTVDHQECMATGGKVCRFKFKSEKG